MSTARASAIVLGLRDAGPRRSTRARPRSRDDQDLRRARVEVDAAVAATRSPSPPPPTCCPGRRSCRRAGSSRVPYASAAIACAPPTLNTRDRRRLERRGQHRRSETRADRDHLAHTRDPRRDRRHQQRGGQRIAAARARSSPRARAVSRAARRHTRARPRAPPSAEPASRATRADVPRGLCESRAGWLRGDVRRGGRSRRARNLDRSLQAVELARVALRAHGRPPLPDPLDDPRASRVPRCACVADARRASSSHGTARSRWSSASNPASCSLGR